MKSGSSFSQSWLKDWWLAEIVAVFTSCVLIALLAVLLRLFDNQPVPSFGSALNGGITLPTVVAFLVNLSVATALAAVQECLAQLKWLWFWNAGRQLDDIEAFDRASRGPLSSVRLLFRLRIGRSPIASLGACLVVSQLFIAPLAQQTVVIVSRAIPESTANASVPAATDYQDFSSLASPNIEPRFQSTSSGMRGAVISGLFASVADILNDTKPICTTGNCTFTPNVYLAVCGEVLNISSRLEQRPADHPLVQLQPTFCVPGMDNICLNPSPFGNESQGLIVSAAGVPPPVDLFVDILDDNTPRPEVAPTEPLKFASLAFTNYSNPLADVYMLTSPDGERVELVEFVFNWCVMNSTTTVVNGIPDYAFTDDVGHLNFSTTSTSGTADTSATFNDTQYTMDMSTHNSLQRYLQATFNGALRSDSKGQPVADRDEVAVLFKSVKTSAVLPDNSAPILADGLGTLKATLANVLASMTNFVQQGPRRQGRVPQIGTAFVQRTVVVVSWPWLAAPAFFSLASVTLLLLVLLRGRRPRADGSTPPVWKSSSIATLRALGTELHRALGPVASRGMMEQTANSMHVHLVWDGMGWRLMESNVPAGQPASSTGYAGSFSSQTYLPGGMPPAPMAPTYSTAPYDQKLYPAAYASDKQVSPLTRSPPLQAQPGYKSFV